VAASRIFGERHPVPLSDEAADILTALRESVSARADSTAAST